MRRDRFLWLILAGAMLLRLWRIRGDLPYVFHVDEPTLVDNAVWMWQNRTLNPHFFHYPTGLIYLLAALYGVVLLAGVAFGRFDGWNGAIGWLSSHAYVRPPEGGVLYFYPVVGVSTLYLIGRLVSVLAATATIAIVYALALRCSGNRRLARIAAVFLALSPLAVEHARYVTTDTTAALLATGCLLAALAAERDGVRRWIVAGAIGGLAAGTKYNAGMILIVLPLLAVWERGAAASATLRRLALGMAAAVVAFLFTTPYALLDAGAFLRDVGYEAARVGVGAGAVKGLEEVSGSERVASVLWNALGLPGIIAAAWGAVVAVRARRFAWTATLAWIAVALAPLLLGKIVYARYMLPAWPAILLLAALGVEDAARRAAAHARSARGRSFAVGALAVMLLAPGTVRLAQREAGRGEGDPRIEMTDWIMRNVPEGERIASEPAGPFPPGERYDLEQVDFIGRFSPERYRGRGVRFLASTGRERLVAGKEAYRDAMVNLEAIREGSDLVWSSGRYAIYRLRGELPWETPVRDAIRAGDMARARAVLENAVRMNGGTPHAWQLLGETRAATGDTSAAIAAFAEAARIDSSDAETPLSIGVLSLNRGDYDEAIRQFSKASKLGQRDNPLIQHNLAVAYLSRSRAGLRAGDRKAARADWLVARDCARVCAKYAQRDQQMAGILDQVTRMGERWGFAEETR